MKRVKRILVPVDFSRTSAAALRAAERIAIRSKARIHLLHVCPVPHGPLEAFRTLRELRAEGGEGEGRKERDTLAAWAERCRKVCGESAGKVQTWLAMGRPGDEITLAAEQIGADLIVMGTRGLNDFRGTLLGSTAAETVRSAGVPVLAIGAGSGQAFDPRRVLVADDLGPGGIAAIDAVDGMFDPETARVLVLHVIDPGPLIYTGVSEWGWAPTPSIPFGDDARVLAELEKRATELRKKGFQVECLVANGSPPIVIARIAQKWRAKALVLATHRRTALARLVIGSTAEAIVRRAPCPVLTVKPTVHTVQATPDKPRVSTKGARPGVAPRTKLHVSSAAH